MITITFMRAISIYDYRDFRPRSGATTCSAGATKMYLSTRPEDGVNKQRSWVSLIGFCMGAVLVASLAIAAIIAGASVALASHRPEAVAEEGREVTPATPRPEASTTFTGMITDSHCGARHMRTSHQNAAECARACFRRGASYVLVDGDRRYMLVGGETVLSKLAGERVNIVGTRQGDAILVSSASEAVFEPVTQRGARP
jgi:hypothetical protein